MTRKGEIDGVKFQIVENNVIEEQNAIPVGRRKQLDSLVGSYINAGVQNGYDARVGAKSMSINAPEFAAILKNLNDRDTWGGKTLSSAEKMYVWSELAESRGKFDITKQAYVGGSYRPDIYGMNPKHIDGFGAGILKLQSYEHSMPYVRDDFHGFGGGKNSREEGFNAMGNWRWEDAKKRIDKHESKFFGGSEGDRQASYFAVQTFHKYRDARETQPGARFDAFADAYLKEMLVPGIKPANMSKLLPPEIDGRWPPKRASEEGGAVAFANDRGASVSTNDRALLSAANDGVRQALTAVPNAASVFTPEAKELAALQLAGAMKQSGLGAEYTHAFIGESASRDKNVMLVYGDPNAPQSQVLHARLFEPKEQSQALAMLPAAKEAFDSAAQKSPNVPEVLADQRQIEPKAIKFG